MSKSLVKVVCPATSTLHNEDAKNNVHFKGGCKGNLCYDCTVRSVESNYDWKGTCNCSEFVYTVQPFGSEKQTQIHRKLTPLKRLSAMTKYYITDEVAIHDKVNDFWVIIHGDVIDLTPLLTDRVDTWNWNMEYLLGYGGKDLSVYFCPDGSPRLEMSGQTGRKRILFPPIAEVTSADMFRTIGKIWSQDPKYKIGRITQQERGVRIINTLTTTTQYMKVCEEDTIYDILAKYKKLYNFHGSSYVWRKRPLKGIGSGRLCFSKTLTENGLLLEKDGIAPALWLYYSDDLTIA